MLDLKGKRGDFRSRSGRGGEDQDDPFEVGQRVRDRQIHREGTIVDVACQYAHPKAAPVYNYLVRWEDGQVQAFGQAAFDDGFGIDPID